MLRVNFAKRLKTYLHLFLFAAFCAISIHGYGDVPTPEPPVYSTLKDHSFTTPLLKDNKATVAIVSPSSGIYDAYAERIVSAVQTKTGVTLSIVSDLSEDSALPLKQNLIIIGNRSTNKTIEKLYNLFFTLLDLKYPGPGGSVVRTLHNPFGTGYNIVFVGGSDNEGVSAATDSLIESISNTETSSGNLDLPWTMSISLGEGVTPPHDVSDMEIWEASDGYKSVGYFGWNSISKQMAMYYMTGNEHHARECLRLAFPDEQARKEISDIDGERIENKDEPLSGPYHYNAHMMILFWDLIEESPVFSDKDRLKITNAFSRQINHRVGEGVYGLTSAPEGIGTRHGQWSAVSLFCLARYMQRDYPGPVWEQALSASQIYFDSLKRYAWIGGENDNLFWYNTGIAPIFTYLLLSGEREAVENGVIGHMAHTFEILLSGRKNDFNLRYSSIGFLQKAAYLLNDGRYLHYRERSNVDTNVFRLGQSFWPDDRLVPLPPRDLVGHWSMHMLTEAGWRDRKNGFTLDESYYYGSYRSAADDSGDYLLMDGYNGESRNPYHTLDILQLRIDGVTILDGYQNQVLTSADGLVEPGIAKNAALKHASVCGSTALFSAEVPDVSFCSWRRSILHKTGKYSLVSDTMNYRSESKNMAVDILWQPKNSLKQSVIAPGHIRLKENDPVSVEYDICLSEAAETSLKDGVITMRNMEKTSPGDQKTFFTLIRKSTADTLSLISSVQIAPNAAALALPEPAIAVCGQFKKTTADIIVYAAKHITGANILSAGLDEALIDSEYPADIDWDFDTARLTIKMYQTGVIRIKNAPSKNIVVDGQRSSANTDNNGYISISLKEGEHLIENISPDNDLLARDMASVEKMLNNGRRNRNNTIVAGNSLESNIQPVKAAFTMDVGESITDIVITGSGDQTSIYASEGANIHHVRLKDKSRSAMQVSGQIRDIHWWSDHKLLVAGCVNEELVAFDTMGKQQWTFTSEMDPEVFIAGKSYWFKTAPGHEGIHGIHSGTFLNNESQLFVGSACTLEILDERGELVKRMPQFWGPPSTFAIIDAPDNSKNLLSSRHINGTHRLGILNNISLDPSVRGFNTVPDGYTFVGGWMSLNRHHLFYEDMDSDGTPEVISEINGTWNRVTIWNGEGTALYDVSFGPGGRIPEITMLDIDIGDLNGDGNKEIYVASAKGYITALDNQCRKLWSKRVSAKPLLVKCLDAESNNPGTVFVALDNGDILILDADGTITSKGTVEGIPTVVTSYRDAENTENVVFGTSSGSLATFTVSDN